MTINLTSLSNDSILHVFQKLDLATLIKMRLTNSSMNSLIEEHRNCLKKYEKFIEIEIRIESADYNELTLSSIVHFNGNEFSADDYIAKLSAIGISKVKISFETWYYSTDGCQEMAILPQLVEMFKKLHMSPKIIKFSGVCQNFIGGVLASTHVPQKLFIKNPGKDFNCRAFSRLAAVKNTEKVKITTSFNGIYDELKGFDSVRVNFAEIHVVREFIMALFEDPTPSRLRKAQFAIPQHNRINESVFDDSNLPSTHFSSLHFLHHDFIHKRAKNSNIYLIKDANKWIVVLEKEREFVSLMWCEKTWTALLETLASLVFDPKKISVDVSKNLEVFSSVRDMEDRAIIFGCICNKICGQ